MKQLNMTNSSFSRDRNWLQGSLKEGSSSFLDFLRGAENLLDDHGKANGGYVELIDSQLVVLLYI